MHSLLRPLQLGPIPYDQIVGFMAFGKGRPHAGPALLFFRCDVCSCICSDVWDGPPVRNTLSSMLPHAYHDLLSARWVHVLYTVMGMYFLLLRAYTYKKRSWHYFLFDLCYYVTFLNFVFIWFLPSSPTLFVACYCLSHGSLASAVITWRNSLVFHDSDKITSLWIHIYAPFTFTVIRHVMSFLHSLFIF